MDGVGLGRGAIEHAEAITGGTQNVLVRLRRNGRDYVLHRPSRHLRANSNETMQREARLLAALAGSKVPHPALVAACDDPDVIGACFYLITSSASCSKAHTRGPARGRLTCRRGSACTPRR